MCKFYMTMAKRFCFLSQFFKQKSFFFFKIYKKSSIKTIQRKGMKKFQDTGQNYYWNFSKKKLLLKHTKITKANGENVENK